MLVKGWARGSLLTSSLAQQEEDAFLPLSRASRRGNTSGIMNLLKFRSHEVGDRAAVSMLTPSGFSRLHVADRRNASGQSFLESRCDLVIIFLGQSLGSCDI